MLNYQDPHYILVVGKRGSGKSHTLGVIVENYAFLPRKVQNQLSFIILDTMNIFHTLSRPNYENLDLLAQWDLEPRKIDINIYEPKFSKQDFDFEDLLIMFGLSEKEDDAYLLYQYFKGEAPSLPNRLKVRYSLFSSLLGDSIIPKIIQPGIHIIRLGHYPLYVKRMVANLLARKLLEIRMKAREKEIENESTGIFVRDIPLIWLFVDEAHEFLDKELNSPVKETFVRVIREGRGPGLSLVLATQQPNRLVSDALTQPDVVIAHKLTNRIDIEAVNDIARNFMDVDFEVLFADQLPNVPGAALVIDDKGERVFPSQVRPRVTFHGGASARVYV